MGWRLVLKRIAVGMCWGVVLYAAVWVSGVMRYPCFSNVSGIDWNMRYDMLISTRGEPNIRELDTREGSRARHTLHYEGVTFFVVEDRIVSFEITGEQYRLGGRGLRQNRIGVGSTKEAVEANFEHRRHNASVWSEFPQNIYRVIEEEHKRLPNAGFGFVSSSSGWRYVEFEFDENDVVIKMSIGQAF